MIKQLNFRTDKIDLSSSSTIRLDRFSVLGNPFHLASEKDRTKVCDAYSLYLDKVVDEGIEPTVAAKGIAILFDLEVSRTWKRPTRKEFIEKYRDIEHRISTGSITSTVCWCYPADCHVTRLLRKWGHNT